MKLSQKKPLRKTSFLALATAWGALLAVLVLPSMALAEIECHGLFPHPPAADNCHAIDFPGPAHNCCMDGAAFECKNDKLYCDECEAPLVCGGNQSWTWCDDEPGVPAVPVCELCPECEPGKVCYKGNCCTPSCEGKECGSDYCGGSCGECEYGGGRKWLLGQAEAGFRVLTGREPPRARMAQAMAEAAIPEPPARVVLAGMMGTGKSTAGRQLARELDIPFLDTDEMVERKAGMSVAEIFGSLGEARFRQMEATAVAQALAEPRAVVALGGGALLRADSRQRVRERSTTVWLWATPEVCAARAHVDRTTRPLLAGQDPTRALRELLDDRLHTYARSADLILDTGHRSDEQVAAKIADEIHQTWPG